MPQLNGDDLSSRFYEALNPVAYRIRNDYNAQGDKEVFADDLPRWNRLRPCDKETKGRQQEQTQDHTDHNRLIERTDHDQDYEGHRDHELRDERRQCRFSDLPRRAAVLRLLGHVDAEGIRHGISNRNRQNAADDDGS